MQTCVSRHRAAQLTLLGTHVGGKVAKAVLMSAAAGKLTPEILGEALVSSSTVRGHVQREMARLLVVRVSLNTPEELQWLLHLIGDCVGGLSPTEALNSLTNRSLFYQVTSFGFHGCAASAITTAAVQIGLATCTLFTTNVAFWRDESSRMSMPQYRYELLTSLYAGAGTVAGGTAGAAIGSMLMPGVGTAFGSVLCSIGGGYLPGYLRGKKGPDDARRKQAKELRHFTPLRMMDSSDGMVLMSAEQLTASSLIGAKESLPAREAAAAAAHPITTSEVLGERGSHEVAAGTSAENAASVAPSDVKGSLDPHDCVCEEADEMEDDEEVVWLDFARAEVPLGGSGGSRAAIDDAATSEKAASEGGSHTHHMRSFLRFFSSPSTHLPTNSALGVGGKDRADPVCSPLDTSVEMIDTTAPADSLNSLSSISEDLDTGAEETSASVERFVGHARYITASSEEELVKKLERYGGEDDVFFLFA